MKNKLVYKENIKALAKLIVTVLYFKISPANMYCSEWGHPNQVLRLPIKYVIVESCPSLDQGLRNLFGTVAKLLEISRADLPPPIYSLLSSFSRTKRPVVTSCGDRMACLLYVSCVLSVWGCSSCAVESKTTAQTAPFHS